MKKLLVILLSIILSLTCISVAFAEDGDPVILITSYSPNCFETISIAGEEAEVEGDAISWSTENRYEQVEMVLTNVPTGLTWKLFKGEEEILAMSNISKSYIRGLSAGINDYTLKFFDEEGNLVKTYSLSIENKGESGGDVFWERWGQLILVLIFLVVFLATIYFRYRRKQKMLKSQANARSRH